MFGYMRCLVISLPKRLFASHCAIHSVTHVDFTLLRLFHPEIQFWITYLSSPISDFLIWFKCVQLEHVKCSRGYPSPRHDTASHANRFATFRRNVKASWSRVTVFCYVKSQENGSVTTLLWKQFRCCHLVVLLVCKFGLSLATALQYLRNNAALTCAWDTWLKPRPKKMQVIGPSQRPLPDNTQHSQQTDVHAPGGIRIRIPSKRTAADPRLRPRGHRNRRPSGYSNKDLSNGLTSTLTEACWCL